MIFNTWDSTVHGQDSSGGGHVIVVEGDDELHFLCLGSGVGLLLFTD